MSYAAHPSDELIVRQTDRVSDATFLLVDEYQVLLQKLLIEATTLVELLH